MDVVADRKRKESCVLRYHLHSPTILSRFLSNYSYNGQDWRGNWTTQGQTLRIWHPIHLQFHRLGGDQATSKGQCWWRWPSDSQVRCTPYLVYPRITYLTISRIDLVYSSETIAVTISVRDRFLCVTIRYLRYRTHSKNSWSTGGNLESSKEAQSYCIQ